MNNQKNDQKKKSSSDFIYLKQLEYDPAKSNQFLKFLLENTRVIFLAILAILLWGAFSFSMLPMESNPEVEIPFAIVSVSLPGAGPADVEELVVKKIEKKIANLSGVKQVSSSAVNSFGSVSVEFLAEEDLKDAIRRLRDAVDEVRTELPAEAGDPMVNEVSFSNSPVWTIVLTGPFDNFTLRTYADQVEEELLKLPGTSDVLVSGGDQYEIMVSYHPDKLEYYGLTMDQVNSVIRANNITLPLGTLPVGKFEYSLRLEGEFSNVTQLRELPISGFSGSVVRLKNVADVVEKAAERKSSTTFSKNGEEPQNAITINVLKKTGFSIIQLIDQGKAKLTELDEDAFPAELSYETTLDYSKIIREDFNNLTREGGYTVLLVTIILFLFVGLKEAFAAGVVIPLVFASTFGFMFLVGQTINFLSLFSLILSLGILVDDAIVVVQATKQYMATGKFTPEEAVLLVFKDFFGIILTTSLTTVFAFLPLVLATGIIGQFIRSIPVTTSLTLVASTIIAILINHPLASILERFRPSCATFKKVIAILIIIFVVALGYTIQTGNFALTILTAFLLFTIISLLLYYRSRLKIILKQNEQMSLMETALDSEIRAKLRHHYSPTTQKSWWTRWTSGVVKLERVLPNYEKLLKSIMNSKVKSAVLITVLLLLFLGAVALPVTGVLKSEFLPPTDQNLMYLNIEGPPGMKVEETAQIAQQVEDVLIKEKQIDNFSKVVGSAGINMGGGTMTTSTGGSQTNRAQFAINLLDKDKRPIKQQSFEFAQALRHKLESIGGARITVVELEGGPPSGSDFEVRFSGDDMLKLEQLANQYKDILDAIPGTVNETTSLKLSPGEFTFKLKPEEMSLRSITPAQIAGTLRTAISGSEIDNILEGEDEVKIKAEYHQNDVDTLEKINSLTLRNALGQQFQLSEVADIQIGSSLTSISRIDQKRVVVLSASVEPPTLPGDVLTEFQNKLQENPLPEGYEAIFGGQNDTNNESILSILRAMIIAFILIVATMVIQFNSFRKAVLILLTIPLAITGVFYGITAVGLTLTFPTLIGVLALFGIVVKNAIMLVDKINLNEKVGIPFEDAILDASKSRLEAIVLTSASTIIGMMPITFYDQTWQGLGAALIFGLSSSTVFTLLLIPVVYKWVFAKEAAYRSKILSVQEEYLQGIKK